jgi:hypothetical protein
MSGMKIKYHKSDVFVLGVEDIVREGIAAKLNYKLGTFPRTYLGVHHRKLRKTGFACGEWEDD